MKRKVNQCVFLADLRLQMSAFTGGKSVLPSVPNSQVHKSFLPAVSELVTRHLGHNALFHEKEVREECSMMREYHTCCCPD